jgi:hypothetical protein
MTLRKIAILMTGIIVILSLDNCKAKSCDTASNVNESRKRSKTNNALFSKKEIRRMKH